jgi:hypothetical protein
MSLTVALSKTRMALATMNDQYLTAAQAAHEALSSFVKDTAERILMQE